MKNSGGESEGNADYVLDLVAGNVEVGGDLLEAVAGAEPVNQVVHASASVNDERLPERLTRVHDHLGIAVSR